MSLYHLIYVSFENLVLPATADFLVVFDGLLAVFTAMFLPIKIRKTNIGKSNH